MLVFGIIVGGVLAWAVIARCITQSKVVTMDVKLMDITPPSHTAFLSYDSMVDEESLDNSFEIWGRDEE